MKLHKGIAFRAMGTALVAMVVAAMGIFFGGGGGPYSITSIRNHW